MSDSGNEDSDPFTSIKQWFWDQFKGSSDEESENDSQSVPKIVVTRGSMVGRQKRPYLLRSMREARAKTTPTNMKYGMSSDKSTVQRSRSATSSSLEENVSPTSVQSAENNFNKFWFSRKRSIKRKDKSHHQNCLKEDRTLPLCGTCGQEIKTQSVSEKSRQKDEVCQQNPLTPTSSHKSLHLSRSNSSRGTTCSEKVFSKRLISEKSANMVRAASLLDHRHRPLRPEKRECDSLKETQRRDIPADNHDSLSFACSWSFNLDKIKRLRNGPARFDNQDNVRLAHSNNDVHRLNAAETPDSFDNLLDYSPKLTQTPIFVNGTIQDDFKKTFQSEAIKVPSIYGKIKVMFQLCNENNLFIVTILDGVNVAPFQSGNLGIYMKVSLLPGKVQKKTSRIRHNTRDPVFYEPFAFRMNLDELFDRQLKVKLYNKPGRFSSSEPVGECIIPLYHYDLTAVTVIWQNLKKCKRQKDDIDKFDFSILEKSSAKTSKWWNRFACCSSQRRYNTKKCSGREGKKK